MNIKLCMSKSDFRQQSPPGYYFVTDTDKDINETGNKTIKRKLHNDKINIVCEKNWLQPFIKNVVMYECISELPLFLYSKQLASFHRHTKIL